MLRSSCVAFLICLLSSASMADPLDLSCVYQAAEIRAPDNSSVGVFDRGCRSVLSTELAQPGLPMRSDLMFDGATAEATQRLRNQDATLLMAQGLYRFTPPGAAGEFTQVLIDARLDIEPPDLPNLWNAHVFLQFPVEQNLPDVTWWSGWIIHSADLNDRDRAIGPVAPQLVTLEAGQEYGVFFRLQTWGEAIGPGYDVPLNRLSLNVVGIPEPRPAALLVLCLSILGIARQRRAMRSRFHGPTPRIRPPARRRASDPCREQQDGAGGWFKIPRCRARLSVHKYAQHRCLNG